MKSFVKTNYLATLLLTTILFFSTEIYSKENITGYSKENISNYFSAIMYANQDYDAKALNHLNKIKSLKNSHTNFNIQFIRTLILLKKYDRAFLFAKEIWSKEEFFFEADLLLGLQALINEKYDIAEIHFERINKISKISSNFEDLLGNILITWTMASKNEKKESFELLEKIPVHYGNLKKIQNSFLQCYFDTPNVQSSYEELINKDESNFPRYHFFLVNYLLYKNKNLEAKELIKVATKLNNSNLLIRQTEKFLSKGDNKKIKKLFNCENPKHVLAEFFYVLANLYSTQNDYKSSNFYLNISFLLNDKFLPNKTLLAENFFYQKKYERSKVIYNSLKSFGDIYSWYSSISIAIIMEKNVTKEEAISYLEKEFNLLINPNYQHYYEFANFYKDNEYYDKSIKFYSTALKKLSKDHFLIPKILDRRGTSYERAGQWEKAEKDLLDSLNYLPDQPYVLNYLAYAWVEKNININKAIEMLERAVKLKEDDAYIIDSLGWAHFASKNYSYAEIYLQRAVEILPLDPVINDHYADTLWMLKKDLQARYFWQHVLSLDETEKELKEKVNKKIIFGVNQ